MTTWFRCMLEAVFMFQNRNSSKYSIRSQHYTHSNLQSLFSGKTFTTGGQLKMEIQFNIWTQKNLNHSLVSIQFIFKNGKRSIMVLTMLIKPLNSLFQLISCRFSNVVECLSMRKWLKVTCANTSKHFGVWKKKTSKKPSRKKPKSKRKMTSKLAQLYLISSSTFNKKREFLKK